MKRIMCCILAFLILVSILSLCSFASTGQPYTIVSTGANNCGGGGSKNDYTPADVYISSTNNITQGLRYSIRNGTVPSSSTLVTGFTDRYDSYNFNISYLPYYQSTGNRYIFGYSLGSSSYTVTSSGTFYP